MPAITLGFAEIERQLHSVRRRRNLVTLQQTLYVWGSLAILAVALLVVLALRGHAMIFSVAFWAAAATVVLGLGAAGVHLWHRWLSPVEVVHWTDRRADLDDRLATLVAHQARPQRTRLANLLVTQCFTLRHRWQPKVLIPRAVPRSVYLFVASLAALATTAFVERPPAAPQVYLVGGNSQTEGPAGAFVPAPEPASGAAQAVAEGTGAMTGRQAATGPSGRFHPGGSGAETHRGLGPAPRHEGAHQAGQLIPDDSVRQSTDGQDSLSRRAQELIRQALGAKPEADQRSARQQPTDAAGERLAQRGRQIRTPGASSEEPSAANHRAQGREQQDERGARHGDGEKTEARGTQPGAQRASAGGDNKGGPGGLLGGDDSPMAAPRAALKTFPLNLSLLAQSARTMMEPQKRTQDSVPEAGFATTLPSEIRLSAHDEADDAVVRTDIPAEHEGIIRRIFSRPE